VVAECGAKMALVDHMGCATKVKSLHGSWFMDTDALGSSWLSGNNDSSLFPFVCVQSVCIFFHGNGGQLGYDIWLRRLDQWL
jgi:hypothetical protein